MYACLPVDIAEDYDGLKAALLTAFELTEEGFRKRFRSCRPEVGETFLQFLATETVSIGVGTHFLAESSLVKMVGGKKHTDDHVTSIFLTHKYSYLLQIWWFQRVLLYLTDYNNITYEMLKVAYNQSIDPIHTYF